MTAPSITREEVLATLGRLYDRGRLTDAERRALNEAIGRLQVMPTHQGGRAVSQCKSWIAITAAALRDAGLTTTRLVCAEPLAHKGPHEAHGYTWRDACDIPRRPEAAGRADPKAGPDPQETP